MKTNNILLLSLLHLTTAIPLANPEPEPNPMLAPIDSSRSAQTCKIINVDNYVNCRWAPSLDGGEILGIMGGEEHVFACYEEGDCYNGYCTWDQITFPEYKITCYVNGYFTDDNCSSSILPRC